MTLADKIWAAIQRPSPPVSLEEIALLVQGAGTRVAYQCGSVITKEDIEDNIVKAIPEGWALDPFDHCYRPILHIRKR